MNNKSEIKTYYVGYNKGVRVTHKGKKVFSFTTRNGEIIERRLA